MWLHTTWLKWHWPGADPGCVFWQVLLLVCFRDCCCFFQTTLLCYACNFKFNRHIGKGDGILYRQGWSYIIFSGKYMQMDNPIKQSKSWKMTDVSGLLLFKDIYINISVLLQKHRGILYMCTNRQLSGWVLLWRRRRSKGQAQLAVIRIFLKCSIFQNNCTPKLEFNHSGVFFVFFLDYS